MKQKIYISGKITGLKNYRRLFRRAEKHLIKRGFDPVNPVKIGDDLNIDKNLPESVKYTQYMRADISEMLKCKSIYLLKNWNISKGAKFECDVAIKCGLNVFHEGEL